jgi:hypothetical protein
MKVFLLCSLNDENYRRPCFEFFKSLSEAHQSVIDYIANDIKDDKYGADREIKYVMDISFPKNRRMRIDYSYGNEHFLVFEVFEIQVSDGDFLCIFHHAYDGVGFCIEKIGTFEECRNQMLDSAAQTANDFDIDITDDDVFEVNEGDSCVDTGEEWHMCNVVQFKVNEIMQNDEEKTKSDKSDSAELNKNVHKYDAEIYEELRDYMYGSIPGYGSSSDHVETSLEEIIKDIDASPKHEIFKNLCNYHGIAPSTVEYLYESIWGKPKDKTVGYFLEKKSIN